MSRMQIIVAIILFLFSYQTIASCDDGTDKLKENKINNSIEIWRKEGLSENLTSQVLSIFNCLITQNIVDSNNEALNWLRIYAEKGNNEAIVMYTTFLYASALRNNEWDENVINWMEKSANINHKDALYLQAMSYKDGMIVEKNLEKFKELLLLAGEKKSIPAQKDLAFFYKKGLYGFQKNIEKSDCWYKAYIKSLEMWNSTIKR